MYFRCLHLETFWVCLLFALLDGCDFRGFMLVGFIMLWFAGMEVQARRIIWYFGIVACSFDVVLLFMPVFIWLFWG